MALTALELANAETDVQTLASVVNGAATDPDVINRDGLPIKTLARVITDIESAASAIIGSSGYEPPVNYAAGLNMLRASQTVFEGGDTYAPVPTAIPFVTGAVFDPSQWRLIASKVLVSRAELKAFAAIDGQVLFLVDGFKTGPFKFTSANVKTFCDGDTHEGLYIKPAGGDGTTGAWVRIYDGSSFLHWWGSVADDNNYPTLPTDNSDVIDAAIATLKAIRLATGGQVRGYGAGASVDLTIVGAHYFSRQWYGGPIDFALRISGMGCGVPGGSATQYRWPAGVKGVVFGHGAAGWSMTRATGVGGWNPADAGPAGDEGDFNFLEWHVPGIRRELQGYNWQGWFFVDQNDAASSGGLDNSNEDVEEDCFSQLCRGSVFRAGGDVNGKRATGHKSISNRQCMALLKDFLGSGYGVIDGEANGYFPGWVNVGTTAARPACLVYDTGRVWACIGGNEIWCGANHPPRDGSTHNQGWIVHPGWGGMGGYDHATATVFGVPDWINGGFYRPGGGVIHQGDNNRSCFDFIYSESDQLCQFDLNVGQIKGNIAHAISVNAGTGTYFPGTPPPIYWGSFLDFSPLISGNLFARGATHGFGNIIGTATDLIFAFNSTNGHFIQFNRFDAATGALIAQDAGFQSAFGTFVVQGNSAVRLRAGSTDAAIATTTSLAPGNDNLISLGLGSNRWSTVFAGTGTINTSDRRHKTNIIPVDDKALDAWGDVEHVQFQFIQSVEEKGDDARLHVGLVAQQIKEAFEKHGLDGFRYGVLCYDEWDDVLEPVTETSEEEYYELVEDGVEKYERTHIFSLLKRQLTRKKYKMVTKTRPIIVHKLDDKGEPVMRVTTPAGNAFGYRPSQAAAFEAAYQRRELKRLKDASLQ